MNNLFPPSVLDHAFLPQKYDQEYESIVAEFAQFRKVIGAIELPKDFAEKAENFRNKSPSFMNYHNYSKGGLDQAIRGLPNSYQVEAFIFAGSGKEKDTSLVIIGGIHGNEPSGVNSALWMLYKLRKKRPLWQRFRQIVIIPRYSPYGCVLGLRLGIEGRNPTFHNTQYPERTTAEEEIFRAFMGDFSCNSIIIDFHEKSKNNKTALIIAGSITNPEIHQTIARLWSQKMQRKGFTSTHKDKDEFPIEAYQDGVYWVPTINPETISLKYRINVTVEAGSREFARRMIEHHISTVNALEIVLKLIEEGKI